MVRLISPAPSGVLVLDKPRGPTSHDVVMRVRRALGVREVGHAGTLDPMATGVLVAAIGEATKLVPWLTAEDKSYEASIALGVETDTLDADGRVVGRAPLTDALKEALSASRAGSPASPLLEAVLAAERARTAQVPPAFSAVKLGGERAYAKARRGDVLDLDPREVRVQTIRLMACEVDPPVVSLFLEVGKGYYVRSLARDFAQALGTVGHLASLRRTRSGSFRCDEAMAPAASADELLARLEPLARAAARILPASELTEAGALDARHGRRVRPDDIASRSPGPSAWLDAQGMLVAVGELDEAGHGRVLRGFTS